MSQFLGTKNIHTTAYHPQANGMVERLYRSLKALHQMIGTATTDTAGTSQYSEGVEVFSCRNFVWNQIEVPSTVLPQSPTKRSEHDILH